MAHCSVVFCSNNWRFRKRYIATTGKMLHFHQFPSDPLRRKEWIIAIKRDEGENFQVTIRLLNSRASGKMRTGAEQQLRNNG